jgi:hypothetical protein
MKAFAEAVLATFAVFVAVADLPYRVIHRRRARRVTDDTRSM